VVWCGVVWCGVVWCGVVWCGVVWCGVVWCGVVWCGVVCNNEGIISEEKEIVKLPRDETVVIFIQHKHLPREVIQCLVLI
jgi:hypothetical protein